MLIISPLVFALVVYIVVMSFRVLLYLSKKQKEGYIKCNFSSSGKKIYHLPQDRFYDITIIDEKAGEFYAVSEEEAQAKGFVRSER